MNILILNFLIKLELLALNCIFFKMQYHNYPTSYIWEVEYKRGKWDFGFDWFTIRTFAGFRNDCSVLPILYENEFILSLP